MVWIVAIGRSRKSLCISVLSFTARSREKKRCSCGDKDRLAQFLLQYARAKYLEALADSVGTIRCTFKYESRLCIWRRGEAKRKELLKR